MHVLNKTTLTFRKKKKSVGIFIFKNNPFTGTHLSATATWEVYSI